MTHFVLHWGYYALFVATLLAAMGIPTGSELVIALAGALVSGKVTGSHQHLEIIGVIIVATIGELIGTMFGYSIGRVGGRPLVERIGKYLLVTNKDLDRAEALFEHHGESIAFFGRFVPLIRSFIGLGAGIADMAVVRFVVCTAGASTIWCAGFAYIGDKVGQHWSKDLRDVSTVTDAIAVLVVVGVVFLAVKRWRNIRASQQGLAAIRAEIAHRGTVTAKPTRSIEAE